MRLPGIFTNHYSGLPRDEIDATRLETYHNRNNDHDNNNSSSSSSTSSNNNNSNNTTVMTQVDDVDIENQDSNIPSIENLALPPNPPNYDDLQDFDPMDVDLDIDEHINNPSYLNTNSFSTRNIRDKVNRYINGINDNVIIPVRFKVVDPLTQLYYHIQERTDFYLNKIGNPIILRRLFYIVLMSMIAFYVMSSGLMPNSRSPHFGGMFSDHELLIQYARQSMDLAKLERDLQYISSMPHSSGTKGDVAISNYIAESMDANNLKVIKDFKYMAYSEYSTGNSTLTLILGNNKEQINIPLNEHNFNPLSPSGHLTGINLIYGHKGARNDLEELKMNGYLESDFILLLKYDIFPNEQVLLAEQYGAKAILFISSASDDKNGMNNDLIQQVPVALPQFGTGDILTPGYNSPLIDEIDISDAKNVPKIPILPLSYNQGQEILKRLQNYGIKFRDNQYSGTVGPNAVKIELKVDIAVKERQPVFDIIGKIEGREQDDKAIVIAASRNSINYGARYPGFGTSVLLSLIQLCQEMKYKYDWKPLRNIYFISFGGNEFNYAGATELIEERLTALRDEAYSFIDITQLGMWDDDSARDINIQTHPLLNNFYRNVIPTHGFNVNIEHVQQYGDWIPYLANGIPTTVISNPSVRDKALPINTKEDTFDSVKDILHDSSREEIAEEMLLYIFEVILKLSDHPYIQFDLINFGNIMLDVLNNFQNEINHRLNTESVEESLTYWKRIGLEWEAWIRSWNHIVMMQDGIEPSLVSVSRWTWNRKLSNIGRRQLSLEGLPNRTFFKNVLFSPTMWTGNYGNGHWTFPGVRDAIDQGDWDTAQRQMDLVAEVLRKSAEMFIEENDEDNIYK